MIVKLEFDIFYTTIKIPDISEEKLRNGLYTQLKKWIKKQQCYKKMYYNDDAVIEWLKETKFSGNENAITILEKSKTINEPSKYVLDSILHF